MLYILGLFLIIGLILGGFTGSLPFDFKSSDITGTISQVLNNFKSKALDFIFPLSENVILVDNLNSNYDLLDRFFSESADTILKSKDVPQSKKEEFKKVLETFNKTKTQVKSLGSEVKKNEPGVIESLIKKVLDIDNKADQDITAPGPTYIPPTCNLVCGE